MGLLTIHKTPTPKGTIAMVTCKKKLCGLKAPKAHSPRRVAQGYEQIAPSGRIASILPYSMGQCLSLTGYNCAVPTRHIPAAPVGITTYAT